jgi:hypothetical protein
MTIYFPVISPFFKAKLPSSAVGKAYAHFDRASKSPKLMSELESRNLSGRRISICRTRRSAAGQRKGRDTSEVV